MIRLSSLTTDPPKYTGNACASHVTGLNITGNVRFSTPDSYCKQESKIYNIFHSAVFIAVFLLLNVIKHMFRAIFAKKCCDRE